MSISGIRVSIYNLNSYSTLPLLLKYPHVELRMRRAVLLFTTHVCLPRSFMAVHGAWNSISDLAALSLCLTVLCRTSLMSFLMKRDPGVIYYILLFIGSQNCLGWKRHGLSTINPVLPHPQLNHVPKGSIHTLNASRDGDSTTSQDRLFPIPDHPFSGEIILMSNLNPTI